MGILYFGASRTAIVMQDQILGSLMLLCAAKLRRDESFMVSWVDRDTVGDGRSAVWVNTTSELHFKFSAALPPKPDQEMLDQMLKASARTSGLELDDASLLDPPHGSDVIAQRGDD